MLDLQLKYISKTAISFSLSSRSASRTNGTNRRSSHGALYSTGAPPPTRTMLPNKNGNAYVAREGKTFQLQNNFMTVSTSDIHSPPEISQDFAITDLNTNI